MIFVVTQELKDLASEFARKEFLPHSASWDAEERLPLEALRKAAGLGFAGMSVRSDVGGCNLPCSTSVAIFEALSYGDVSTTCFLTIQNMVAFIIDRWDMITFARNGSNLKTPLQCGTVS